VSCRAVDGGFDTVEGADPIECLLGDRRTVGDVHIKKLPSHVRPACSFDNTAAFVEVVESGIAISMEHTREVLQMLNRVLAFAIRGIEKHGRWRPLAAMRTFVANVCPQPPRLGLAGSWGEN